MTSGTQRLAWVDMAKGLSIFLVVIMYCAASVGEDTGQTGFLHWTIAFAMPFRMPEFFLISGLFLSQVIDRPWRAYADRRALHYFYFYALWATIHIVLKVALAGRDPAGALGALALAVVEPYGVWWFIYMLGVFSVVSKLLRQVRIPHAATMAVAAMLQVASIQTGSYLIDQFAAYFVYFYAGYIFAPQCFRLAAWTQANRRAAVAVLLVWALGNAVLVFSPGFRLDPVHIQMGWAALPGVHLLAAFAGAIAIITAAALLVSLPRMDWLRRLGTHSLVIYLAFVLPMGIARSLLLALGIEEPNLVSLVIMAAAITSPLVLWWITKKLGFGRFLFERPGWAHLPGTVHRVGTIAPRSLATE
ncbi:MAG: acyltransferase family protein [Alphaproteobacteria bacterium]|nr:acyltransferase family protein [Alphaproteobacteria bacterium]MBU1548522.1 acyltransferase family protein [Alphaproteobacteria bacterium]MBU2337718.1 acyltransferase family protein [Alphaproteobacteria bacterium]MBU2389855.1 acyltransferase family protein [Alphaproteobacteria bacterium]